MTKVDIITERIALLRERQDFIIRETQFRIAVLEQDLKEIPEESHKHDHRLEELEP